MKKIRKIFILIILICFCPLTAGAFFAAPDPYVHSMPFGIEKDDASSVQPLPPNFSGAEFLQPDSAQNDLSENSAQYENQEALRDSEAKTQNRSGGSPIFKIMLGFILLAALLFGGLIFGVYLTARKESKKF